MCISRLHRVLGAAGPGAVEVEDVQGGRRRVSLLALDGPAPLVGEWLVVHSGYAIDRVDSTEAEAVAAELQRGRAQTTPAGTGTAASVAAGLDI
ncbi:MAG: HypC/HybG/HupF family hydrogenase formation chaperone [Acidimicrobiales bacterium]|jgi:hydrogenase maturation factor